jgi:chitin synthase
MRWTLIGSIAIYVVPMFLYAALYNRGKIIIEVVLGCIAFIFYTPTYLIILNIYSMCRMDDISWGTKGIETTA